MYRQHRQHWNKVVERRELSARATGAWHWTEVVLLILTYDPALESKDESQKNLDIYTDEQSRENKG